MNRTVLVGGGFGTVGLALLGLDTAGVLAGVATTLWLAWWERRKELAVASGRFVWDRDATFGIREVEAGPEPEEAKKWGSAVHRHHRGQNGSGDTATASASIPIN